MRDARSSLSLTAGPLLVLALCSALGAHGAASAPDETPLDGWRRLSEENERLRLLGELAAQPEFYLVLDPAGKTLALGLRGVTLAEYRMERVEIGAPRTLFVVRGDPPTDWRRRIWPDGRLEPGRVEERMEIRVPEGDASDEDEVVVPPDPAQLPAAPQRWWVRFEGGFALEVRRVGAPGARDGLLDRLTRGVREFAGVWSEDRDGARLRIELEAEDADRLYRSLPPHARLLVL